VTSVSISLAYSSRVQPHSSASEAMAQRPADRMVGVDSDQVQFLTAIPF
jgi:hypothetical protein